jgi:hypothetical protein
MLELKMDSIPFESGIDTLIHYLDLSVGCQLTPLESALTHAGSRRILWEYMLLIVG